MDDQRKKIIQRVFQDPQWAAGVAAMQPEEKQRVQDLVEQFVDVFSMGILGAISKYNAAVEKVSSQAILSGSVLIDTDADEQKA